MKLFSCHRVVLNVYQSRMSRSCKRSIKQCYGYSVGRRGQFIIYDCCPIVRPVTRPAHLLLAHMVDPSPPFHVSRRPPHGLHGIVPGFSFCGVETTQQGIVLPPLRYFRLPGQRSRRVLCCCFRPCLCWWGSEILNRWGLEIDLYLVSAIF
jgi:hypothetical protein